MLVVHDFYCAAKPSQGERFLWDSELEDFGLRVFPAGRKSYLVQYRNAAGRTRRLTLGLHGKLTPAEARQLARERLMEAASGGDPSQDRRKSREAPTVAELVQRFLGEHVELKRKATTAREYRRLLEKHVLPSLGRCKAEEVELADVDRLHRSLRSKPDLANRLLAVVSSLLNQAERWGVRPRGSNPCPHVDRYRESRRERYLSGEELSRLRAATGHHRPLCSPGGGPGTAGGRACVRRNGGGAGGQGRRHGGKPRRAIGPETMRKETRCRTTN